MSKISVKLVCVFLVFMLVYSCNTINSKQQGLSAKAILGNPDYLAMSYGGYRFNTRDVQPTITDIKEDMKLLSAMGVKIIRTYNVHLDQASNILKAIKQLKKEEVSFEMYVMLGIWIDCENAFNWEGKGPNHTAESLRNPIEVNTAVKLAQEYSDIIKILAVGNEAMVKWATAYYVQPSVILKWVNHLQGLKKTGVLSNDLWITSSDNYAAWGGGSTDYHIDELNQLIKAVDYISMHTYPMHDTHYNPEFWGVLEEENEWSGIKKIEAAMLRSKSYAIAQYDSVYNYMTSLGVNKPIHIGETGWASFSDKLYGDLGSKATDQYKQALYYKHMREWTMNEKMSCFYFEAFDENWKDADNVNGSENHFGLFTIDGKAKYALWYMVDIGVFKGLTRNGNLITKTFDGNKSEVLKTALVPKKIKK